MSYSMSYIEEHLNITANTLRFYEKEGLLKEISRDSRGRRVYNDQDIAHLEFIRCLRATGMPISGIKQYLELHELGDKTLSERKEILIQHKLKIQEKLNEDLKHLEMVSYKAAMCELKVNEIDPKQIFLNNQPAV
ncbi:MerR family transcriptional regulator [Cohnella sp. CBP 2801]|uniref:MerR family transcriptional regulator n=2 Tax=Cohnella zeiphila TaxID=2761120 RepID=A0A7X0SS17_9BACL|nr:MerR family transcriptional regulator [Cohnella zeiphila]